MTTKIEWEVKKAKFEYFGSIIGILAASVTLAITLGGTIGKADPPPAAVVQYNIRVPFFEALTTELLRNSPAVAGMTAGGLDLEQVESQAEKISTPKQNPISDEEAADSKRSPWVLALIGLSIGLFVWSAAVSLRRPSEMR